MRRNPPSPRQVAAASCREGHSRRRPSFPSWPAVQRRVSPRTTALSVAMKIHPAPTLSTTICPAVPSPTRLINLSNTILSRYTPGRIRISAPGRADFIASMIERCVPSPFALTMGQRRASSAALRVASSLRCCSRSCSSRCCRHRSRTSRTTAIACSAASLYRRHRSRALAGLCCILWGRLALTPVQGCSHELPQLLLAFFFAAAAAPPVPGEADLACSRRRVSSPFRRKSPRTARTGSKLCGRCRGSGSERTLRARSANLLGKLSICLRRNSVTL